MDSSGTTPSRAGGCRCVICHRECGLPDSSGQGDGRAGSERPDGGRHAGDDPHPITTIAACGWTVAVVAEDDTLPGWAYTVGLWHSFRSAELAMFGLATAVLRSCVDDLAELVAAGRPIAAGDRFDDRADDRPVQLRAVEPPWLPVFFGRAVAFHRTVDVPFLQVVWPDRRALFPRQFGSGSYLRQRQPQLWRLPEDHPQDLWSARR